MTALLKKDMYVADKQFHLLAGLGLLFGLIPNMESFGSTYALMVAFMIPLNAIAYDEKCKWDRYAAMLPYRVSELVGCKYLLGVIYTLLAMVIVAAGAVFRGVVLKTGFNFTELRNTILMLIVVMVFVMNFTLPMLFRFGTERGRILMILMLGVAVGLGLGIVKVADTLELPSLPVPAIAAAAIAVGAVMTVVSIRVSMVFYKNRQDGKYD